VPQAILKFSLPDEGIEFRDAVRAGIYAVALNEIDGLCRKLVRYGDHSQDAIELASAIRAIVADTDTDLD
jgi:hypothetical protein